MNANPSSKVFPTMANKGGGSSRLAMKSSQQRLKEARARIKNGKACPLIATQS
jgi:hypothetical protein